MKLIDGVYELLGMPRVVRCARRSAKWPALRKAHLAKRPECIACGKRAGAKEIHHVDPVHYDPSRELDPTNLVTLCSDHCHITFGHWGDFKLRNLDVAGECERRRERHRLAVDDYRGYPFPEDPILEGG